MKAKGNLTLGRRQAFRHQNACRPASPDRGGFPAKHPNFAFSSGSDWNILDALLGYFLKQTVFIREHA
jgi:hypothetical protein